MSERKFVFWQGIKCGTILTLFLVWLLVLILEETGVLVSNMGKVSLNLILAIVLLAANIAFSLGMYIYNKKKLDKIFTTKIKADGKGLFYYADALDHGYLSADHHPDNWYKKENN